MAGFTYVCSLPRLLPQDHLASMEHRGIGPLHPDLWREDDGIDSVPARRDSLGNQVFDRDKTIRIAAVHLVCGEVIDLHRSYLYRSSRILVSRERWDWQLIEGLRYFTRERSGLLIDVPPDTRQYRRPYAGISRELRLWLWVCAVTDGDMERAYALARPPLPSGIDDVQRRIWWVARRRTWLALHGRMHDAVKVTL